MKVAQLSDLHIGFENEATMLIDVRKNFLKMLAKAMTLNPDFLVLSGDLCYRQAEKEVYEWIKQQLDQQKTPYFVISGNHDNAVVMAETFGLQTDLHDTELYYCREIEHQKFLFLDTSLGSMSERQLQWFQNELTITKLPCRIFMHHPPVYTGVRFMDTNYAFRQCEQLMNVFKSHPTALSVFCGHYHYPLRLQYQNLEVNICPSTYFHLNPFKEDFEVIDKSIGLASIVFYEQGQYDYSWIFDQSEALQWLA